MDRPLFTPVSVVSLICCIGAGVAYFVTMTFSLTRGVEVATSIPWLGWTSLSLGAVTVALLWRKVFQIRAGDNRVRRGLCRRCGYDLRSTPDRCPECGAIPALEEISG